MTAAATTAVGRRDIRLGVSDEAFALRIVLAVIGFNFLMIVMPLVYSAWLSVHETNVILQKKEFVGGVHYAQVLSDPVFLDSLRLSLMFTAASVILSLTIGLGIALVLNEEFRGRNIVRTLVLLPWAISEVVVATAWIYMVNPTFGALNGMLAPLGLVSESNNWLTNDTAIYWMAIAYCWHIAPLGAFFFLAALQTVPRDLYRAARIDGASAINRFLHVTYPHIRYVILIVLVVVTIEAFRTFDVVFAFTRGGPGTSSQIVPLLIYRYTFEFTQFGLAAAASYVLIVVSLVFATIYFVLLTVGRRRRRIEPLRATARTSIVVESAA